MGDLVDLGYIATNPVIDAAIATTTAKAALATTKATEAAASAAAAAAVPTTTDGLIAGRINDPASATATALSATTLAVTADALENPESAIANAVNLLITAALAGFSPDDVPIVVNHGANASFARPTWAGPVIWQGTVEPNNRIAGDSFFLVETVPVPWTPLSIPTLHTWYDPTEAALSGANITSIPDKSGNDHHLTTVTGAPTYSATGLNGNPGMVLNGSSRIKTAAFPAMGTGPLTVFFTGRHTATGIASFFDGIAADNNLSVTAAPTSAPAGYGLVRAGGAVQPPGTGDTLPHVFCAEFNGASSKLYIDGVLYSSGTTLSTDVVTGLTLGGRAVATNRYITGAIGDFILMSGLADVDTFANAHDFLAERSGVTVA